VTTFRDAIAPCNRPRYDQAIAEAARILAEAGRERDELAARGGAGAVADAAYIPAGPSKEEIATVYGRLQAEARDRNTKAADAA
jgi:hypothetical protein